MLLLSLLSGPCPWSGQLWSVAVAATCLALWICRYLTVLYFLNGRRRLTLLVLSRPFLCRLLTFTCRSTTLARSPLSLCLRCGRVLLSSFGSIAVSSSHWPASSSLDIFGSHCRFAIFLVRPCVMTESWPICACLLP